MKRTWLVAGCLVLFGCVPSLPSSYHCSTNSQCVSHGILGTCEEPIGACSFPDAVCASLKRYGSLGPPQVAGMCVPVGGSGDLGSSGGDLGGSDLAGVSTNRIIRVNSSTLAPGSPGATATVPRPAGVVAGDLLFASIFANDSTITVTAPAGWTTSADLSGSIGGSFRASWFYHFAGPAEPTSYDFALGGSPNDVAGAIVAYRGVASAPIDVGITQQFEGSSFVAPSITTTHANDMLLAMFVNGESSVQLSWTAPTGMTTAVNLSPIGMFDQPQAVAGATGTRQAGFGVSAPGIGAVDFVALTPAP